MLESRISKADNGLFTRILTELYPCQATTWLKLCLTFTSCYLNQLFGGCLCSTELEALFQLDIPHTSLHDGIKLS